MTIGSATRPEAAREVEEPDAWITAKIQAQHFLDPDIKGSAIDVTTEGGTVTLQGNVPTLAQQQSAGRLRWRPTACGVWTTS